MHKLLIKVVPFLLALFVITAASSCAPAPGGSLVPDDYRSWEKTTATPLTYPIPGHENHLRIPYINEIGEKPSVRVKDGVRTYDYPKGTIIVKEIYDSLNPAPGSKPIQLTVMIKAPDDHRSRGGWLWVVKDPATGKETVLLNEFCQTCHANANRKHPYADRNPNRDFRDYTFFVYEEPSPDKTDNSAEAAPKTGAGSNSSPSY